MHADICHHFHYVMQTIEATRDFFKPSTSTAGFVGTIKAYELTVRHAVINLDHNEPKCIRL